MYVGLRCRWAWLDCKQCVLVSVLDGSLYVSLACYVCHVTHDEVCAASVKARAIVLPTLNRHDKSACAITASRRCSAEAIVMPVSLVLTAMTHILGTDSANHDIMVSASHLIQRWLQLQFVIITTAWHNTGM